VANWLKVRVKTMPNGRNADLTKSLILKIFVNAFEGM